MRAPTTRASLLARLSRGDDPLAWREFVDRYGRLIGDFARAWGLHAADVDDVAQEVMTRLTAAMPRFEYDPAKGSFRGWLKTITVNIIRDRLRQNRVRGVVQALDGRADAELADDRVEAIWESEWRQHLVREALRTIDAEFNARDVAAFRQYAVNGEPAAATAEALGMSLDQVYQAKSRILRRLAEAIEEGEGQE